MKTLSATSPIPAVPAKITIYKYLSSLLLMSSLFSMVVRLMSSLPFSTQPFPAQALPLPVQSMHAPILPHPTLHRGQHVAHLHRTSTEPLGKVVRANMDFKSVSLHSIFAHYTSIWTGTASCGGSPCSNGEITVRINTRHNVELVKRASIQPDGHYRLRVRLDETPQQIMDWMITAKSGSSQSIEQGRQILTDDSAVPVNTTLILQE